MEINIDIQTEIVKEVDDKEWNTLIEKSINSTIFHTLEWKSVMERTNKGISPIYIIARDKSGEICGGLQLFKRKIIPRIYCLETPPWGNPVLIDESSEDTRRVILNQLKKLKKKFSIARIFLGDFSNTCSYLNQLGFKEEQFFSYHLKLEDSFEWLWQNKIHGNVKRNFKKAQKNDIVLEKVTNLSQVEQFYQFSEETELRLNNEIFHSLEFYNNIFNIMEKKGMIRWHLTKMNNITLGGTLCILHKDTMFNYMSCTDSQYFKYSPNFFIICNCIKWGFDNGYKYYSFGGNPEESTGVSRFKESWGAERKYYNLYYKNKLLYNFLKNVIKLKSRFKNI